LRLRFSGTAKLGDQAPFLVFHEGAGDLAHHLSTEIITVGQVIAGGGQEPDTTLGQQGNAELGDDELAGKPAGVLDNNGADAIAFNAVEQPRETLAALDRIRATYRGVVIPVAVGDFEASSLGERLDGGLLPTLRVPIDPDVSGRARPQIRNSRGADLGHTSRRQMLAVVLEGGFRSDETAGKWRSTRRALRSPGTTTT
jgi:hypothetical protein